MGGYTVRVVGPKKRVFRKQGWHAQILSTNGEILFWSEQYVSKGYALDVARAIAEHLGAGSVEEWEEV